MAYSPDKFDIGIVNTDAINVGFMLAQKNGVPAYSVFDDVYLASQFFTDVPGYGALPSEKELALRQDSWRAGFGLDIYDSVEPERYYNSRGMDMRFRGMGIAGQAPANSSPNISYPVPSITDGGLETWVSATNLASWTEQVSSANVTRSITNVHGGTNSARLFVDTSPLTKSGITQLPTWHNMYRSSSVIVNTWVQVEGAISTCNLEVSDGVGLSVAKMVGNTAYQLLTVNHVFDSLATQLNIHIGAKSSGAAGNAYVDDVTISYTPTNSISSYKVIRSISDYNDKLYFGSGEHLLRMDAVNGAFTALDISFPANITSLAPFTDNKLYIANNIANPYSSMNVSEGIETAGAGVNTFQFFKTVHSASPTMWGNDENNKIRSNPTPNNAASWSGQTTVGSNYHNITDLLTRSAALYIMKEDMPYYLNSSGAVQNDLAPKLTALTSPTSGKNAHTDGDKIWIPAGSQSLIEEDGGTLTWRTPALFSTNLTDYSGRIAAVTSDDMYVYVVINGTGVCHVLAGRNETIGSSTQWVWHPIAEIPISACETAYVSSVYKKRLWIASNTGELFYIPLYADYGNPTNDTDRSFASNVEMQTPFLHANFKDTTKAFPKITALLGHSYNASVFFNCYYKKLEDSGWTQVSDLVGNSASRVATSFLPDDASNVHPFSTMMRFRFVVNTAYTDKTPMLLGYNVQGLLYPPKRTIISCIVRCAEEMTLRDGTRDSGSYAVLDATISEALKAKWPVTINDVDGQSKTVKFLPLPGVPRWTTVVDEKSRKPERWYGLMMQVVDLS